MKICIIKLGALGDVVRTLPVLQAIKEKYPFSEITWITKKNVLEVFEGNNFVDRVLTVPVFDLEEFDVLYNFDIEEDATNLAKEIIAEKKFGFYNEDGFASAFNEGSEYYLNTLFDDELKKNNRRTYQEMMFDVAELEWKKQMPEIFLNEKDKNYAKDFLDKHNLFGSRILGIH